MTLYTGSPRLKFCSDNHEEICYEGQHCPVCEKIQELEVANEKNDSLKGTLGELKDEVDDLNGQLASQ